MQRLKSPVVRLGIERRIVGVAQQLRNRGEALLVREHARLRQTARGPLTHGGRGIVVHGLQQRLDGLGRAGQRQTFDGPASRVFIGIFQMSG